MSAGDSSQLVLTRIHFDVEELGKDDVYRLVYTLFPVEFIYHPLAGLKRIIFSLVYEGGETYRAKLRMVKKALDKCGFYRVVRVALVGPARETIENDVRKAVAEVFGCQPVVHKVFFLGTV